MKIIQLTSAALLTATQATAAPPPAVDVPLGNVHVVRREFKIDLEECRANWVLTEDSGACRVIDPRISGGRTIRANERYESYPIAGSPGGFHHVSLHPVLQGYSLSVSSDSLPRERSQLTFDLALPHLQRMLSAPGMSMARIKAYVAPAKPGRDVRSRAPEPRREADPYEEVRLGPVKAIERRLPLRTEDCSATYSHSGFGAEAYGECQVRLPVPSPQNIEWESHASRILVVNGASYRVFTYVGAGRQGAEALYILTVLPADAQATDLSWEKVQPVFQAFNQAEGGALSTLYFSPGLPARRNLR